MKKWKQWMTTRTMDHCMTGSTLVQYGKEMFSLVPAAHFVYVSICHLIYYEQAHQMALQVIHSYCEQ